MQDTATPQTLEEHISLVLSTYASTKKLPLKVRCTKCSEDFFGYNVWDKRIQEFGSFEGVLRNYVCRSCGKVGKEVVKQTKRIERQIEKEQKEEIKHTRIFLSFEPRTPLNLNNPDHVKVVTGGGACWRPDLFFKGGKDCHLCNLYDNCMAGCKKRGSEQPNKPALEDTPPEKLSWYQRKKLERIKSQQTSEAA